MYHMDSIFLVHLCPAIASFSECCKYIARDANCCVAEIIISTKQCMSVLGISSSPPAEGDARACSGYYQQTQVIQVEQEAVWVWPGRGCPYFGLNESDELPLRSLSSAPCYVVSMAVRLGTVNLISLGQESWDRFGDA